MNYIDLYHLLAQVLEGVLGGVELRVHVNMRAALEYVFHRQGLEAFSPASVRVLRMI